MHERSNMRHHAKYRPFSEPLMRTAENAPRPPSGAGPEQKVSDPISPWCRGLALGCTKIRPGSALGRKGITTRSALGLITKNGSALGWALGWGARGQTSSRIAPSPLWDGAKLRNSVPICIPSRPCFR